MRFAVLTLLAILAIISPATAQVAKGLVVHEWGVFRVNEDVEFANADLRAVWDELPSFVYGYIKGRAVPQHWGAVEVRKCPVVFFHAEEPLGVQMRVEFPKGMAGAWFPATENPSVRAADKQPKIGGSLEWKLWVKKCHDGWKEPALPEVAEKHWFNRLRQVKSDEVFAKFSRNNVDVERERFVYYDGLFPQSNWLKVTIGKDSVSLVSRVKHPVFDVTMVDRRDATIHLARIAKIDAGESIKKVEFSAVDSTKFVSEAAQTLVTQLVAAGMFDDEARSLVDLWKKEFFETPGINLFYRIPQEEYDAKMPLTIEPKPKEIKRVGLVFHAHLEPDFADRIWKLVQKLDAARFADREAAMKKLVAIGPAALVQLQRIKKVANLSADVADRIDGLIKRWSAAEAFDQ